MHTVLTGPESDNLLRYGQDKFAAFQKERTKLAFDCYNETSDEYVERLTRYWDQLRDDLKEKNKACLFYALGATAHLPSSYQLYNCVLGVCIYHDKSFFTSSL